MSNPLYACSLKLWDWCARNSYPRRAIDAGANEGGYVNLMLQAGIECVHAFEPVPDVFDKLFERYKANPKVFLNKLGLSDYKGAALDFTVCEAWTIGKPADLGLSVSPGYKDKQPFDVTFTTIDDYMGGAPIGLIKLDVDGYEHKVLAGGDRTIIESQPFIFCEFSAYIEKVSGSAEAFVEHILALGYVVAAADGSAIFDTWASIKPHYPFNTSFDVMLLPRQKVEHVLAASK